MNDLSNGKLTPRDYPSFDAELATSFDIDFKTSSWTSTKYVNSTSTGQRFILHEFPCREEDSKAKEVLNNYITVAAILGHQLTCSMQVIAFGEYFGQSSLVLGSGVMHPDKLKCLADCRPASMDQKLAMIRSLATTLSELHRNGISARILTPDRLYYDGTRIIFRDLGALDLANSSDTATCPRIDRPHLCYAFKPVAAYTAPECLRNSGQHIDEQRSDVYAFGVIAYEILVGHAPFDGSCDHVLWTAANRKCIPIRRVEKQCPGRVSRLIQRCLDFKPGLRPSSLDEVVEELDRYLLGRCSPVAKIPDVAPARSSDFQSPKPCCSPVTSVPDIAPQRFRPIALVSILISVISYLLISTHTVGPPEADTDATGVASTSKPKAIEPADVHLQKSPDIAVPSQQASSDEWEMPVWTDAAKLLPVSPDFTSRELPTIVNMPNPNIPDISANREAWWRLCAVDGRSSSTSEEGVEWLDISHPLILRNLNISSIIQSRDMVATRIEQIMLSRKERDAENELPESARVQAWTYLADGRGVQDSTKTLYPRALAFQYCASILAGGGYRRDAICFQIGAVKVFRELQQGNAFVDRPVLNRINVNALQSDLALAELNLMQLLIAENSPDIASKELSDSFSALAGIVAAQKTVNVKHDHLFISLQSAAYLCRTGSSREELIRGIDAFNRCREVLVDESNSDLLISDPAKVQILLQIAERLHLAGEHDMAQGCIGQMRHVLSETAIAANDDEYLTVAAWLVTRLDREKKGSEVNEARRQLLQTIAGEISAVLNARFPENATIMQLRKVSTAQGTN